MNIMITKCRWVVALVQLFMVAAEACAVGNTVSIPWNTANTSLLFTVAEEKDSEGLSYRQLNIFLGNKVLFKNKTPDTFVSAFALRDEATCFISLWTTGSAYRIKIFGYKLGKITEVLEVGSKGKFGFSADGACPDVITFDDGKRAIYHWNGDVYKPGSPA